MEELLVAAESGALFQASALAEEAALPVPAVQSGPARIGGIRVRTAVLTQGELWDSVLARMLAATLVPSKLQQRTSRQRATKVCAAALFTSLQRQSVQRMARSRTSIVARARRVSLAVIPSFGVFPGTQEEEHISILL